MKTLFCLFSFIFFLTVQSFSQDSPDFFPVTKLQPSGILLDKGWKFQAGDNPAYALPDYDDTRWQPINPTLDIYDVPQLQSTPVGWLRIHLRLDSALLNKPLAFQLKQYLASEIYLNGILVKKYGVVSTNSSIVDAWQPQYEPFGVQFASPDQVIAVRFSFQPDLPYFGFVPPFNGFMLRISTIEGAYAFNKYEMRFDKLNYMEAAFFLLLFLIHLSFFIVYPKQKANLFFALSTFFFGIGNILYVDIKNSHNVAYITHAAVVDWNYFGRCIISFYFLLYIHCFIQKRENNFG